MSKATLHTDGGARGNPGPAGIGFVLNIIDGETIEGAEYIGEATNNHAEYAALQRGLAMAQKKGVQEITCYLDSELVVKQLKGEYRVKHALLRPLYENVQQLARQFDRISFQHIVRAKNKKADLLVNKALDAAFNIRKD
ncbi:MAG: ribonuclease HI family protein [Candidatus Andersenbacteria bacterium]